uniref:Uncharacterized protein n=1 Tax=Oryza nivara TaxID=4536 RepID=A0A0E0GN77_ORYNI
MVASTVGVQVATGSRQRWRRRSGRGREERRASVAVASIAPHTFARTTALPPQFCHLLDPPTGGARAVGARPLQVDGEYRPCILLLYWVRWFVGSAQTNVSRRAADFFAILRAHDL